MIVDRYLEAALVVFGRPKGEPDPRAATAHSVGHRVPDQPRGTTGAFFDVEFATTGWTALANVTGWAAVSLPAGRHRRGAARRRPADGP